MAAVTVFLAPGPFGAGGQFSDANGNPLALGQITTYLAGTTTPAPTYTGPGLTQTQNSNPIILGPDGRPPQEIWIPQGVAMKFIVTDALGSPVGPPYDNLSGINDASFSVSEWIPTNLTPTQINGSTFSVPGNLTSILHADRRLQTVNAGGTLYGAVVSSSFAAGATTVIIRTDTGQALDAGLSAVLYGFVSAFPGNTSVPMADTNPITGTNDATRRTKINSDRIVTSTTRTLTMQDADLDLGDPSVCTGRLTFTQGVAFPVADITGVNAIAIFFQPVRGTRIALFDVTSGKWNIYSFTQNLAASVPNTTNQMYDVFAAFSAPNLILETVAWTNDTTRATGLDVQDGVLVKTGDHSRRYLGSFRTTAVAGQSEDSIAKRYLWNFYNRALRKMKVVEATATWAYTTNTWRQANANAANQLDFVIGVQESVVKADVLGSASNSTAGALGNAAIGIGLDQTTANNADITTIASSGQSGSQLADMTSKWSGFPGIGRHTLAWLEIATGGATNTFFGSNSGAIASGIQAGITGELWG